MVLGHEITGEIIEIGRDVEYLKVGDLISVPFNVTLLHGSTVVRSQPLHPLSCEANVLRTSKLQHAVQ